MSLRIELDHNGHVWRAQGQPTDLSVPIDPHGGLPRAWYKGPPEVHVVRSDGWTGAVADGGAVNFRDIHFNPHAHGTHTETHEHIHDAFDPIDAQVRSFAIPFVVPAFLLNATPVLGDEDHVVPLSTLQAVQQQMETYKPAAIVIRTGFSSPLQDWSSTNPPYLENGFADLLCTFGIQHLLIDLPSVDKEIDGGALQAHNAFFGPSNTPRSGATISELLSVPKSLAEGVGLLALQIAPLVNDAAPSRPVWFPAVASASAT